MKSSQMRCSSVIGAGKTPRKAVWAALSHAFSKVRRVSDGQQLQLVVLCPETG